MWYRAVTTLLWIACVTGVNGETGAKSDLDLDKRGGGRMGMINYDHLDLKRGGARMSHDFDDDLSKRGGARFNYDAGEKRGGARFRDDTDEKRRYSDKARYADSFSRLEKRPGARFYGEDDGFSGDAKKRPGAVGGSRYNFMDDRMKRPGGKAWAYNDKRQNGDISDEYEDDSDYRRKRARSGYPSWLRTG